jgi:hypothetical protein
MRIPTKREKSAAQLTAEGRPLRRPLKNGLIDTRENP